MWKEKLKIYDELVAMRVSWEWKEKLCPTHPPMVICYIIIQQSL